MLSAILVANPAASQFTGGLHRTVVRVLGRSMDLEAVWPQSAEHAHQMALEAAELGVDLVIAMGGDGIVHHVAQGVVGTPTGISVIPAGTTNVVARHLGMPARPAAVARALARDLEWITHPVVETSFTALGGAVHRRSAVFALGAGPDAAIVEAAEAEPYRKYSFGWAHYARTAVGTVWRDVRKRRPGVTITAGDRSWHAIGLMAQFLGAYTYLGRFPLRFERIPPDPMSLLVMEGLRLRHAGPIVLGASTARGLAGIKGFTVVHGADRFRIDADPPDGTELQVDGEFLGRITSLDARHRPGALRIAVPSQRERRGLIRRRRPDTA